MVSRHLAIIGLAKLRSNGTSSSANTTKVMSTNRRANARSTPVSIVPMPLNTKSPSNPRAPHSGHLSR